MSYSVKNTKKVLLINVTCGFGSTGRIVLGIYNELVKNGCHCVVAYGRGEAPEGVNSYRIGSELDVNIHGIKSRITDRQGFYSTEATKRFIERIKEYNPDVIHLHNIHGYYLNVKLLFDYIRSSGVKVVWTLHDCWSFTGHCAHFEFIGCNKWMNCCGKCDQLKEYPKSMLFDSSRRNYLQKKQLFTGIENMIIVTPSQWLMGKVKQSYMSEYPVEVVPTGINLSVFGVEADEDAKKLREKYRLNDKFVILGVASPWRDRKGLDEFIKLSRVVSDRYKIVMLGLKDKQLKKIPSGVVALPRTDSIKEMAAWYRAADVYVNLTLEDTFPTTNIEALACGTPVITYKAGGSPESIDDTCGIVVPRLSLNGVVAALDVIRTGENREKACIDRAQKYSMDDRFRQYLGVYIKYDLI